MNRAWQRLTVYLGLREDPAAVTPRPEAERPGLRQRVLEAAPGLALVAIVYSLLRLVGHLIFGGDTSVVRVLIGALAFFVVALVMVPICDGVARWWRESGDRQTP